MNICKKISLTGLMLASSAAFAVQPAMGWYAGLMLGASYPNGVNFTLNNPFVQFFPEFQNIPASLSYNLGINGGAQAGYRCDKFRFEGELNYSYSSWDRLRLGYFRIGHNNNVKGLNLNGKTGMFSGFFNVYYDIFDEENTDVTFVPYLGLGLGYAGIGSSVDFYLHNTQLNFLTVKQTNNAPIGQAMLGLNYFFTDNSSLGTDFRYMSTRNIKIIDSRYSMWTWNLIYNYSFDTMVS